MENTSLWNSLKLCRYNEKEIKETDILIAGGGLTGVLTAYFLKDSNEKVTIIDKGSVGRGVTANSTAKISYIQRDVYQKLNKDFGFETCKLYYESQVDATNIILDIADKYNIDCDLKEVNSYLFANTKSGIKKVDKEMTVLKKLGVECYKTNNLPINFMCETAFYVKNTYVFHPLKFIYGVMDVIKNVVKVCENTMVLEVQKKGDGYVVFTNNGIIKTLVNKVYLYDEYMLIYFNTQKEEYLAKVPTIIDVEKCFDSSQCSFVGNLALPFVSVFELFRN